ncbi:MAG: hypothetical protein KKD05_01955 [Candidatus Omnitrophica bacterium]|nr:hypothetical protein [Candidatus Omnitrophota bacterium]
MTIPFYVTTCEKNDGQRKNRLFFYRMFLIIELKHAKLILRIEVCLLIARIRKDGIMACPIKETCTFFNNQMRISKERQALMKNRLCFSFYSECARMKVYLHFKNEHKVPASLYPNDFNGADIIIKQK